MQHSLILRVTLEISMTGDLASGLVVKNPPSNGGDAGSIPGSGTKPGTCKRAT